MIAPMLQGMGSESIAFAKPADVEEMISAYDLVSLGVVVDIGSMTAVVVVVAV